MKVSKKTGLAVKSVSSDHCLARWRKSSKAWERVINLASSIHRKSHWSLRLRRNIYQPSLDRLIEIANIEPVADKKNCDQHLDNRPTRLPRTSKKSKTVKGSPRRDENPAASRFQILHALISQGIAAVSASCDSSNRKVVHTV